MKVLGYCRVSTENQKEEGTIEMQVQEVKLFCSNLGYELVEVFKDDGFSGAKDLEHRPGLANLFDYLEENSIDGLVVWKLDRLARDLYIQEHLIKQLEKLNVKLISTKEPDLDSKDPMRKAFRQFMGIIAEVERAFITMRMVTGRQNKARKGGYSGGNAPIGYQVSKGNKALSVNEEKAEVVKRAFEIKQENPTWSLDKIANQLNLEGHSTKENKPFHRMQVKRILDRADIYLGQYKYSGIQSQGQHKPII